MGFSRQEYWSGLPCPRPGDLPHPGIELASLYVSCTAGGFFTTSAIREAQWFNLILLLIPLKAHFSFVLFNVNGM